LFAARVFEYFTSIYVPHPSINKFEKEIIEGAEKRLYEFVDEHFSEFPNTKTVVVAGDASEEIIHYWILDTGYWILVTEWYFRFFSRKLSDKNVKKVPY
jgi:hypothetical protein